MVQFGGKLIHLLGAAPPMIGFGGGIVMERELQYDVDYEYDWEEEEGGECPCLPEVDGGGEVG